MTQSQTANPGTMTNVDGGETRPWTNIDNAKISDNNYADADAVTHRYYETVQLIKAGTKTGDNKSTGAIFNFNADQVDTFGANNNLWNVILTPTDINSSTFGIALRTEVSGGASKSDYLQATNFGFTIPPWATIIGIEVKIEEQYNFTNSKVDSFQIIVYYSDPPFKINIGDAWKAVEGIKINIGDVWKEINSIKINANGSEWVTIF